MENHLKDGLYPFSMRDTLKGKAAFSMPRLWIVFGLKGMTYLRNMDNAQPSLISLKLFNFFIYGTMVIFTGFFQLYLQDIGMSKIEIGVPDGDRAICVHLRQSVLGILGIGRQTSSGCR